uniref:Uncharacterized protein n=1 Tax=Coturnix japonica TaxID=93934 RepID=A0A8C2TV82_COTJA
NVKVSGSTSHPDFTRCAKQHSTRASSQQRGCHLTPLAQRGQGRGRLAAAPQGLGSAWRLPAQPGAEVGPTPEPHSKFQGNFLFSPLLPDSVRSLNRDIKAAVTCYKHMIQPMEDHVTITIIFTSSSSQCYP